jgi:transcriptional regulator NrdR family protein
MKCPQCRRERDPTKDAREVGRAHDLRLDHLHHCPRCFQLLTPAEAEAAERAERIARSTVPED